METGVSTILKSDSFGYPTGLEASSTCRLVSLVMSYSFCFPSLIPTKAAPFSPLAPPVATRAFSLLPKIAGRHCYANSNRRLTPDCQSGGLPDSSGGRGPGSRYRHSVRHSYAAAPLRLSAQAGIDVPGPWIPAQGRNDGGRAAAIFIYPYVAFARPWCFPAEPAPYPDTGRESRWGMAHVLHGQADFEKALQWATRLP